MKSINHVGKEVEQASKKKVIIWSIVIIILIIIGAGVYFIFNSSKENIGDAQGVADQFYSSIIAKDYDSVAKLYHPKLLEVTNRTEMDRLLQAFNTKLGDIQSYVLINYNAKSFTSGQSQIVLFYAVNRTNYNSKETISLYKEDSSHSLLIVGYHVSSTGLV